MAYTEIYGAWQYMGSHLYQFRSYLDYSIEANDDTTYTVRVYTGIQLGNNNGEVGEDGIVTSLTGTGKTTQTVTTNYRSSASDSQQRVITISSFNWTWTKTHSAQTITISSTISKSGYLSPSTASITLTIPKKTSYTISYNANGNGGTGAPSSQTKWHEETLTLSSTVPTRTGYTFSKWNTKSDGSGTNYSKGGSYTANAATTLYAVWTIKSYTLTAQASDGTIPATTGWTIASGSKKATKSVNYNAAYSTLPTPTRTGYTFKGWYTALSGGTKVSSSTKMGDAATIIYAQWIINSYTLTANAQSGTIPTTSGWTVASGGGTATKSVNYSAIYGTLPTPTRDNYKFNGWFTAPSGGTSVSSTTTMGTTNKTIYAQWLGLYDVTYYKNIEDSVSDMPANGSKTEDIDYTISTNIPKLSNYRFKNWNTASDGSGTTYSTGSIYTNNAALSLYAQWEADVVSINYDENGGTFVGEFPANVDNITAGTTVTLADLSGITYTPPTIGQRAERWNTRNDGKGDYYSFGGQYIANTTQTLYVEWKDTYENFEISNLTSRRTNQNKEPDDTGDYGEVYFNFKAGQYTDTNGSIIYTSCTLESFNVEPIPNNANLVYSLKKIGSEQIEIGNTLSSNGFYAIYFYFQHGEGESEEKGLLDTSITYNISLTFTDNVREDSSRSFKDFISPAYFIIDISSDGKAISFGKAAVDGNTGVYIENGGLYVDIINDVNMLSQAQNLIFASPINSTGKPIFRSLNVTDIPNLAASKITSGTLDEARIPHALTSNISITKDWTAASTNAYIRCKVDNSTTASIKDMIVGVYGSNDYLGIYDNNYTGANGGRWILSVKQDTKNIFINGTTIKLTDQTANFVLAGPTSGSNADPSFRALVAADIPDLAASKITSGTFDTARIPSLAASKITSGTLGVARLPEMFQIKSYSYERTTSLAAGAGLNISGTNFGVSTPSNYKPIGVVFFATSTKDVLIRWVRADVTGSSYVMGVSNVSGSAVASFTAYIDILYAYTGTVAS